MAGYVRTLVPEASVTVAHGQMPENQLERAMIDFAAGKMDVLVCTTIIESGLDIPNVNTLIVNRADTFGLAQLYQLRGRVGRGTRRAYAYLLVPPYKSITETAEKRLKTMLAATELGAGFQIAMKDLEIRGAGNILGAEQSGYIHSVGFELYARMLSDAVEGLRAQRESGVAGTGATPGDEESSEEGNSAAPETDAPASVELGIPANVPDQYISDLPTRLNVYRRLGEVADANEADAMEDELKDRFGPLPWQVQNLLYVVRLRLRAREARVQSIARENGQIVVRLLDEIGGAQRALQRHLGHGVAVGHTQIRLHLSELPEDWESPLMDTLAKLAEFRQRLVAELEELGVGV
jgi:transcription-repair coupling factor (superfamily II helicase)